MSSERLGNLLLRRSGTVFLGLLALLALAVPAHAQRPVPYWQNGAATGEVKFLPAPWPSDGQWIAYTNDNYITDPDIDDPRTIDPSHGGARPQSYVNISSGCPDKGLPSVYYYYNSTTKTIFFRWRVEDAPNNYGTGPAPGVYGSTNPWNSGQWTVLFDIDGDGYRDFAVHLNGSSGDPANPIDVLNSLWSPTKSQSVDYVGDPTNIHKLFYNPTGFVSSTTQQILQFDGSGSPATIQWPNGASETYWDYGPTRAINISTSSCKEFYVDYQIPLAMLDATAVGGPKLTETQPFAFIFATANSLNDPFQKDVVYEGDYVCPPTAPAPFGDPLTLLGGVIEQPIATKVTSGAVVNTGGSCPIPLIGQILDTLYVANCQATYTLTSATFVYWYDANGNNLADEPGGAWYPIPSTLTGTTLTATWDVVNVVKGPYLVAIELKDSDTPPHIQHITQTYRETNSAPYYTNLPMPGMGTATKGVNWTSVVVGGSCGASPPTMTKVASPAPPSSVSAGGTVTYTLTLTNPASSAVSVSQINDSLPPGFTFLAYTGGTLIGTETVTPPSVGASGNVTFSISPSATLAAGSTRTFTFTVASGSTNGLFYNTANAITSVGTISGSDTTGVLVKTAKMAVTKSASLNSSPTVPQTNFSQGDQVRFTITYSNPSPQDVTSVVLTDPLPTGFTYVSASPAPASAPAVGVNGTVTWNIGTVAANTGPFSVYVVATATQAAAGSKTNTVTLTSANAATVQASVNVWVSGPVLSITKVANRSVVTSVAPNNTIDYTIQYSNIGDATANVTTITDALPTGFTFSSLVSSSPTVTCSGTTTITCTPTVNPYALASGSTGTMVLRFTVGATAVDPSTNTATVNANNATSASTTYDVRVASTTCTTSTNYFRNATVNPSSTAGVLRVDVTAGGTGYTTAPTVTFTGGGGTGAAATAVVFNGIVYGVNMTSFGTGYTTPPTITFGGPGTGASASAALTSTGSPLANTTSGTGAGTSVAFTVGPSLQTVAQFFTDPVDSSTPYAISTPSVKLGWNRTSGSKIKATVSLYDFNPADNSVTLIASATNGGGASGTGPLPQTNIIDAAANFTWPAVNYTLRAGRRLLWRIQAQDGNGNSTTVGALLFDGDAATNGGAANTYGSVCRLPLYQSLTKTASVSAINPTAASPANQYTYTLSYTNPNAVSLTGVTISDPLPAGTTFVSATGTPTTAPAVGANGTVIWTIGTVAAGATASVTVTVAATPSIVGSTLTNTATMSSNEVPSVTASNTISVVRPNVQIAKSTTAGTITLPHAIVAASVTASNTFTVTSATNLVNGSTIVVGGSVVTITGISGTTITVDAPVTAAANSLVQPVFNFVLDVSNVGTASASTVTITDPLPSGMTSTVYPGTSGTVALIQVTSGGSGYTSAPTVTITGTGTGASATAIVSGGAVKAVRVTYGGTGYTAAPSVGFSGGGGAGALATATLATVTGTSSNLTFTIATMPANTTATITIPVTVASATVAGSTTVTNTASVTDTSNTTPRTASADVTITANPILTLTEVATPSAYRVNYVDVTNGGSGYTSAPTVVFTAAGCSTPPTGYANIYNGVVTGVTITSPGSGCAAGTFAITFTGGGGGGATATTTTGPGPGDTITYVLTVSNVGAAPAEGVVVYDNIPSFTTFTSSPDGSYSSGKVSESVGTVGVGSSTTTTYTVTVAEALPKGMTTLTTNGGATSTNTPPPSPVTTSVYTGAAPAYAIAKGPSGTVEPYPVAQVYNGVSGSAMVPVRSSSLALMGNWVAIYDTATSTYKVLQVVSKTTTSITLSGTVTAPHDALIYPVVEYTIAYSNTGNATGTSVTISDLLPGNLRYGGYPSGYAAPSTSLTIGSSGLLEWTVATLPNDSGGILKYYAFATSSGAYTNTATIRDGTTFTPDSYNATASATNTFGALVPLKGTSTPTVTNFAAGVTPRPVASYAITVTNPLPDPVSGVSVTDNLPTGFTYKTGTTKIDGVAASDPGGTSTVPVWSGLSIIAGGTVTITFDAEIDSNVPNGTYQNEIIVGGATKSLEFDHLATTAEDVKVCNPAPSITAPTACGGVSTSASIELLPAATYSWSITGGTITSLSTGTVHKIVIGSGGTGYTSGASVVISGGGGSGATATATVVGGVVTAITMTSVGSGYTSAPTVSIVPVSGGTGATAAGVLGTGIVYTPSASTVTFTVQVARDGCITTSTASAGVTTAPTINAPGGASVCNLANVTWTATVSNASTFQWQVNTGSGWTNIPSPDATYTGGTSTTLSFQATTAMSGYQYRLIASNGSCTQTSAVLTLTVGGATCNQADLVPTISDSPDPVYAGNQITYTESITNIGPNATTGTITWTQSTPASTTFQSITPPAGWTCTTPAIGATGTITCTTTNVIAASGSSGDFTLVLNTDPTLAAGSTITLSGTVSGGNDGNASNNTATATTSVLRQVDVGVYKTNDATVAGYGAGYLYVGNPPSPTALTWSMVVTNGGSIRSITVATGGSGYTAAPLVTISGGGGTGATATAVLTGDAVTAINIVNPGYGYTSTPTVTVAAPPAGVTATATAVRSVSPSVATNVVMSDPLPDGFTYTSSTASQGSCTNSAASVVTCTIGTLQPNGYATISVTGNVTVDTTGIDNTATVTRTEPDSYLPNDTWTSNIMVLAPTVVQMRTMEALATKSGVTVRWHTQLEVDNLGFNVYRQAVGGGELVKLNKHIIVGSALTSRRTTTLSAGFSYRFKDVPPAGSFVYFVEDIDMDGVRTMNGPITPQVGVEDAVATEPTEPDVSIGSTGGVLESPRGMGVTPAGRTGPLAERQNTQLQIAAQPAGKIVIAGMGWTKVSRSQLIAGGYDPGSNSRAIAVFADGIEVPIEVNDGGDGKFDAADTIEFFGSGADTATAGSRIYYVVNDKGKGARVKSNNGAAKGTQAPASFAYTYWRKDRTVYLGALLNEPDGENFVGTIVSSDPATDIVPVENVDPSGTAELEIVVQGFLPMEHEISIRLNQQEIGRLKFYGASRGVFKTTLPASQLVEGDNAIEYVELNVDDVTCVESKRLTYPHRFVANDGLLGLTVAAGTEVKVSGFASSDVKAVDLTDEYEPVRLSVKVGAAADGSREATFVAPQGAKPRAVLVYEGRRVVEPLQVVKNEPSTWSITKNQADLVIIAHRDFLGAASTLKKAREAEGLATVVADVQNLYDEFSFGEHGPAAIKAFLQQTQRWARAPKYAILLGDASFDPRNYYGFGTFDFVPSKTIASGYMKTVTDDWFGDFDNDGITEVAIGRLAVRTADEANAVVAKLVTKPVAGPWTNTVTLINDTPSGSAPFDKSVAIISQAIPSSMTKRSVDFATSSNPAADVVDSFQKGSLLTTYVGHGSVEIWSSYWTFTSYDAAALTNSDRLPFVIALNCLNGLFNELFAYSMAEGLMNNPAGGAMGVFAGSALTSSHEQVLLGRELTRGLLSGARIGDAVRNAKRAVPDGDSRRTFILFGDPTMKLPVSATQAAP